MKPLIIFFACAILSTQTFAQLIRDSLLIEQRYRTFSYYKPKGKNYRVLFALHGSGGNAGDMMRMGEKFQSRAEDEKLLVVYADGYGRYWNECRKSANTVANKENINEQAFFTALIGHLKNRYSIDEKNVFAIGFSGGGHMIYKFGMTMPGVFRGLVAVVANLPTQDNLDCVDSRSPVSIMIVNGTADPVNPYDGGEIKAGNLVLGTVRSTDQTFMYWSNLAGYNGKPDESDVPDAIPTDDVTTHQYSFLTPGKPEVTLLKVSNGKHEAPKGLDVFAEAWKFCKRQMAGEK